MGKLSKWCRHSLLCTVNPIRLLLRQQHEAIGLGRRTHGCHYDTPHIYTLAEIVEIYIHIIEMFLIWLREKGKVCVLDVKRLRINIVTKTFNSIWMYGEMCLLKKANGIEWPTFQREPYRIPYIFYKGTIEVSTNNEWLDIVL